MKKIIGILFILAAYIPAFAQITMPKIFNDHMVLQRQTDIPIWGKADPGTKIQVELADYLMTTTTNTDGNWKVYIPELPAGGPYELKIYNAELKSPAFVYSDVLIGDVWLASGQSNMEWQVQQSASGKEDILKALNKNIRFFKVPHHFTLEPQDEVLETSWTICDTASVKDITAVGYYFAKKIQADINVPIGIVQSTWGGTPVEAWTSREMLLTNPAAKEKVIVNDTVTVENFGRDSVELKKFWDIVYNPKEELVKKYADPKLDDSDWRTVSIPGVIKNWKIEREAIWHADYYEGMIWLRKKINLKGAFTKKDLTINLGHPEMNYSIYFNGIEICKNQWNANATHTYTIPATAINKGENTIALRMAALWGGGGLNPPADVIYLTNGKDKLSLTGDWKFKKGLEPLIPKIYYYQQYSTYLFNGMINPLLPFGLKGFIWYQGENNEDDAYNYHELFAMMITDWRIRFEQGYLPFLFIQLPNYYKKETEPSDGKWAVLRESQYKTLALPNTGMVTTIDLGETDNIHPTNKKDVGNRLAAVAENLVYKQDVAAFGPMFKSYEIKGNIIEVEFTAAEGLKTTDGEVLKGFAIAGEDKKYHWATAKIEANKVIISAEEVENPVAVRYDWANNPDGNLTNNTGLPAAPFRTDNWKVITQPE